MEGWIWSVGLVFAICALLSNQRIHNLNHPGLETSFDTSSCSFKIPQLCGEGRNANAGEITSEQKEQAWEETT